MPQPVKRAVEKRRARLLKTRKNVRKTFPPEADLRALARSVMKRQLHPFVILPEDVILDGECRWRGLMLENPEFEVDVIVVDRELPPAEITELQLISALHSTTLSAYDQSFSCKEWMEATPGATAKELAEKIDRDPSMLTRLLSLWKCIPPVIKAAEEGKIGPKAWYQISLLPEAEMAGLLAMHLSGMPADQIASISRQKRKPASTAPAARLSRVRCALPSGVQIVVSGAELSLDELIEAFGEAAKEAKRAREQGLDIKTMSRVMADKAAKG
jgi:ParB family transcriptional regulator, chromosome partitioning protein